jgi:hypothetical protein
VRESSDGVCAILSSEARAWDQFALKCIDEDQTFPSPADARDDIPVHGDSESRECADMIERHELNGNETDAPVASEILN